MKRIINIVKSDLQDLSYGICEGEQTPNAGCAQIKIKNLSIKYGTQYAIKNVSLDIVPCAITAFVGPSGCGKTSLLSAINRISDLSQNCKVEGEINIGQTRILSKNCDLLKLRKRVGMIFQKPTPFPLSIRKNIETPLKEHGVKSKKQRQQITEETLINVGLWEEVKDRLNQSAKTLSGGQQQRLCIARTLALKPEIILFDEPCSSLDPLSTAIIEDLILKLKGQYSIILVTHNLAQAKRIADHVAFFWQQNGCGSLIEYGPKQQIFENPKEELTAIYTASA